MLYFLAIIFPPLAVLLAGKPGAFILNCFLTLLGWFPGVIHALFVISSTKADRRTARQTKELKKAMASNQQAPNNVR